jgi:hypothetical protein
MACLMKVEPDSAAGIIFYSFYLMHSLTRLIALAALFCSGCLCPASTYSRQDSITVIAGSEYKRSALHQFFWGKNRRKEWTAPVRVPVVLLDSLHGGLTPYRKGGGNESKTLRLKSPTGKEYVIRSINKSREAVTPRLLRNSYFGMVIQDGVSMSYPYGALAVPVMMSKAGIYHTEAKLVYVPSQKALDTFDTVYGGDLYLLEERPEGDWSDGAPYLGHFKKFFSTKEVFDKMTEDGRNKADQHAFIKSRLFDILLADWDRNHDNWRWGTTESDPFLFLPIARDRDQAFFTRNGIMMPLLMPLMRVSFMQNFGYSIEDVSKLTKQDRALDEIFTNAMRVEDWINAANQLRDALTDSVITASIHQLPAEIFRISGDELIKKLISRRNDLQQYAVAFYQVLAKLVTVNGTSGNNRFVAKQMADGKVLIEVFDDHDASIPFYTRAFMPGDTKKITLKGFGGSDVFDVDRSIKGIKIITETNISPSPAFKEKSK